MDKAWLCEQLKSHLRKSLAVAMQAAKDAAHEAKHGASAQEKRANARINQEYSNLARAQHARAQSAERELETLESFDARPYGPKQSIGLGALIDVEDEIREGRTLFIAPTGAGITLTGPGGDGFFSVITPASPIGRAVMGRRLGETVDVRVRGQDREWTITYLE